MEVIPYGISVKRGSKIKLYPIGDIHAGVKHCEEHKIKELVQEIQRDKEAYWIGVGDYADYIAPTDPRWDSKVIANWVDADNIAEDQTSWLEHLLKPIRSKCMGLCFGNHEETIRLRLSCNVHKNLCESLNVPSLGYSGFVKLTTNRSGKERNTIICVTHGAGSAATKGARINRLKEFMSNFDADIYIHGHLHDNHYQYFCKSRLRQEQQHQAKSTCWCYVRLLANCLYTVCSCFLCRKEDASS